MRFIASALLLVTCARPVPPDVAAKSPSEELAALFDAAWEARLEANPVLATYEGRKIRYGEWTPYTEEFARASVEREEGFLARIQAIDPAGLSDQERLSVRLYADEVAVSREALTWRRHGYPVDQMNGMHAYAASFLMEIHEVADAADAQAYVSRLQGMPTLLDQVIAEMEAREAIGVLPPRFVYPMVIDDCRNLLTGAPFGEGPDSPILADFRADVTALGLPEAETMRLIGEATAALRDGVGPAYERLIAVLERQQGVATDDDGVWKLPDGDAYYAFLVRLYTTTDLDPTAVHELGLKEVARIHGEMEAMLPRLGFQGDLHAFMEHLRTDPKFYFEDTPEGRAAYLAQATAVIDEMRLRLPEVFATLPKAPIVVKAVEPYREESAGKAFYEAGTPDGSRPGIYYANLSVMGDMPIWQLQALAYHEGIPGHHMQRAIQAEMEGLPEIRTRADRTAYSEGWGLYAERLPADMGLYTDPISDFGRLAAELWRACRLVTDTGIHHDHWTREQAVEYLLANTPTSRSDAQRAIERYIVFPGQANAYTLGLLAILDARERARTELGDAFDLREFHDVVLKNGPVPLDVLGEIVDGWIATR